MKSKEEIEILAEQWFEVENTERWGGEVLGYIEGYIQCQEDMADTSKVTRFEVIDENGRAYTTKDCKVELSYQDDGRTLKVFIKPLDKQDNESK